MSFSHLWQRPDPQKRFSFSDKQTSKTWPSLKQIGYLPKLLHTGERIIIKWCLFFILICLGYFSYDIYQQFGHDVPAVGGHYTEALIGYPNYINPALAYGNDVDSDINALVFSGLLKRDGGKLILDVASDYDISADQKTYTFKLRDDVFFHDGIKLTAYDVAYTVGMIQDPQFKSPYYNSFANISVEAVNDQEVKFILQEPYTPFLDTLTLGILPEHIWSKILNTNAHLTDYNLEPIGSGPYEFDRLGKDKRSGTILWYTIKRNPQYYQTGPFISDITFKFYPDLTSAISALENGYVNGISYIPQENKASLGKLNANQTLTFQMPQYTALFFNAQKNDLLKDKNIRQALSFTINRDILVNEALHGQGASIWGPILPGYIGYNPDINKNTLDIKKATDLIEKAGFTKGKYKVGEEEKQIYLKKDQPLKITLSTVDTPEYLKTAEIISKTWNDLGILTDVSIFPSSTVTEQVLKPRGYEILLFGEILGTDPDPLPFWHSSQAEYPGLNLALFANRHVDKLLEEGRQTNDLKLRDTKYKEFEKLLLDEYPAIFLYSPTYTYITDKSIHLTPQNYITVPSDRFSRINEWYLKTQKSF